MGSNMAEAHPVGFQWVMEAKSRGAQVIHIDPRFTRTSAVADTYVPIRAGTDIAFLGGVINYILTNELDFREYVAAYTNAAVLISDEFRDTEDLDGLFSGYDADTGDATTAAAGSTRAPTRSTPDVGRLGRAQGADPPDADGRGGRAAARRRRTASPQDPTLQDPHCVYQILKRHFARYTPEMVERVCGTPPEQFRAVCEAWVGELGPGATAALVYSVGWTQHSVGAQYIRAGAIIQLLLGNIGRPGGGVFALRGHASIQGSTDIPTLFNLLPGYLPMPSAEPHDGPRDLPRHRAQPHPEGLLVGRPTPTWCRCSRSTSASTRRRRTTSASTCCRGSTATTARTARSWTWSTAGRSSATSCSGRTRPSARRTASCSAWAWRTWTGWSSATSP